MLILKFSHARPTERLLFLVVWLGTRILVLKVVTSQPRSIRFISSLAQCPKLFSKEILVLIPVKVFHG